MPGLGIFLPSETAYKDPGRFRDVLEAEGTKQARYLSAMDQFYAGLEETKRQFDVTAAQRERFFEEELAFGREKLESEEELQRWMTREKLGVERERIRSGERAEYARMGAERERLEAETGLTMKELGLRGEELGLKREELQESIGESRYLRDLYDKLYGGLGTGLKTDSEIDSKKDSKVDSKKDSAISPETYPRLSLRTKPKAFSGEDYLESELQFWNF